VQEHACWALRNLTTNADNQVKIAGMGASRPSSGGLAMTWRTLGCPGRRDSAARAGALTSPAVNADNQVKITGLGPGSSKPSSRR